jgi:hypothetical protein
MIDEELVNAFPSFLNVFGVRAKDGSLNIAPSWQNGIGAATNCGEVIGLQVRCPIPYYILVLIELGCWYHVRAGGLSMDSHSSPCYIDRIHLHPFLWYATPGMHLR